jgi:hypothetical protein
MRKLYANRPRRAPAQARNTSGGPAMGDEDKAKAEKEDRELAANRMLKAVLEELHQKHKGDEKKVQGEFMRRCQEDAALQDAVLLCTSDGLRRELQQ